MSRKDNEERAKRVEQYYIRHGKDKKKTYQHFHDEGLSKKTIYHILRRHDTTGNVQFKKPTGRKVSVCTPEMFNKLASIFKDNPELSCREAAKQLGVARTTIFRIMAKMREKNIETYKVIDSIVRCPTCHQRLPPKTELPKPRPRKSKGKGKKEQKREDDDDEDDEDDDNDEAEGDDNDEAEGRKISTML